MAHTWQNKPNEMNPIKSKDPKFTNARLFVGNLNTFQMQQKEVTEIFQRYGRVMAVSVHIGYAFVQFFNEANARAAAANEDRNMYAGQVIDVTMANEPKKHRPKKGVPGNVQGNPPFNQQQQRHNPMQGGPPQKRQRNDFNIPRQRNNTTLVTLTNNVGSSKPPAITRTTPKKVSASPAVQQPVITTVNVPASQPPPAQKLHTYMVPDILICGQCKQMFTSIKSLSKHRENRCHLKIVQQEGLKAGEPSILSCATCGSSFETSWELMQHCQYNHNMNIYMEEPTQDDDKEEDKDEVTANEDKDANKDDATAEETKETTTTEEIVVEDASNDVKDDVVDEAEADGAVEGDISQELEDDLLG
ncbi:unnamed protein product [Owenia fusiformis]|uniref:Uncharacterized protein n=1 Tax=Owenia fusiformis TaxID=6347 RepID=A0A8J1Y8Y9_OWEFU|nr:unnamed protein product [Owenia fusiformis]